MNSVGRGKVAVRRAFQILAMVAAIQAAPLGAQTAPANNTAGDAIGPEQLRDFSLGAKPASPPPDQAIPPDLITPSPSTSRPIRRAPAAAPPAATTTTRIPVSPPSQPSAAAPAPSASTAQARPVPVPAPRAVPPAASSVTVALPPADPLARKPTPAGEGDATRLSGQPMGRNAPLQSAGDSSDDSGSLLPWIIALLMLGGAAIFYAIRTRGQPVGEPALAAPPLVVPPRSVPSAQPETASIPQALVQPRMPVPVGGITIKRPDAFAPSSPAGPQPATSPRPIGIVSTRLRPWLEIEFEPTRAVIDEAQASVQFDVVVTNSGSAPARQVLVEACMVNAGPEQDGELRRFFEVPVGAGDRIDSIPPLGRISLKSAVSLPLDQVRAYEIGGRKLFVPLVAFNALYAWGSGQGQSSAAFILGRLPNESDGESDPNAKMAPLRLDLGPRQFRGLEGRRHPLGMRR